MQEPELEQQVRLFLYELECVAKEHWFKRGEQWTLAVVVSASEMRLIERNYVPVLSVRGNFSEVKALAMLVNDHLHPGEALWCPVNPKETGWTWLVAYNGGRERR